MKAAKALTVAVLILSPSSSFAAGNGDHYPPSVDAFITREAQCNSKGGANDSTLACDRLGRDRAVLLARYRGRRHIVGALRGHWIKVVERVPVHDTNPSD